MADGNGTFSGVSAPAQTDGKRDKAVAAIAADLDRDGNSMSSLLVAACPRSFSETRVTESTFRVPYCRSECVASRGFGAAAVLAEVGSSGPSSRLAAVWRQLLFSVGLPHEEMLPDRRCHWN